ncbi:glycosyltransferase family protein [Cohnella fermenti]|uniref:Glycosyl transferase n=1 Tax=Cohnella fermenti TaxID=2565925 RepID=A0A4S4BXM5_9BACL|nr:hypothetical protein [Cohnella fermenti]THF79969.1 hypothetical protein E6C55_11645 [Cohnella fermenti]
MIIGTVVTSSHLPRAQLLAQSARAHCPAAKFIVSLVERELDVSSNRYAAFDEVVLARSTWVGNFDRLLFQYGPREASCFAKGPLLRYAMNRYPSETSFLFLDSDTEIMAPLDDLEERFARSSVLLIPQHLAPGAEYDDFCCGVYNAGMIGASRTTDGIAFVDWWSQRLERHAYCGENNTLFAGRKWLDLVPSLFKGVEIVKHPGYNVARWNYSERKVARSDTGRLLANGLPLFVMHFHAIGEREKEIEDGKHRAEFPVVSELTRDYATRLDRFGRRYASQIPWSYNFFTNGELIKMKSRRIYRESHYLRTRYPNPFALHNAFFEEFANNPVMEEAAVAPADPSSLPSPLPPLPIEPPESRSGSGRNERGGRNGSGRIEEIEGIARMGRSGTTGRNERGGTSGRIGRIRRISGGRRIRKRARKLGPTRLRRGLRSVRRKTRSGGRAGGRRMPRFAAGASSATRSRAGEERSVKAR